MVIYRIVKDDFAVVVFFYTVILTSTLQQNSSLKATSQYDLQEAILNLDDSLAKRGAAVCSWQHIGNPVALIGEIRRNFNYPEGEVGSLE